MQEEEEERNHLISVQQSFSSKSPLGSLSFPGSSPFISYTVWVYWGRKEAVQIVSEENILNFREDVFWGT